MNEREEQGTARSGGAIAPPRGSNTKVAIPRTQRLTGIALFSALAIVLNLVFKIPAPYATFLTYELWEIPIVIAFLMFGVYSAVGVSAVNTVALLLIYPGALPTGPLYNLAAILFLLIGVGIGHRLSAMRSNRTTKQPPGMKGTMTLATGLGIVIRVVGETVIALIFTPMPPPIGFNIPVQAVIPLLPLIAFFNATISLYTVPIAYATVRAVSSRYRMLRLSFPFR